MSEYVTIRRGSADITVLSNPTPPIAPEWISTTGFWDRFTNAELVDYDVAMQHDASATVAAKRAAARLRIFRREASDAGRLRLGRQKVADFVASLEGSVLAAGRAAAILGPITDDEAA